MAMVEKEERLRIDKYLWAIRIFKSRALAAAACEGGKVKLNAKAVKPAHAVKIDEQYEIKLADNKRIIVVTGLLLRRVSFSEAQKYYIDMTPEEEKTNEKKQTSSFYTGKRRSKIGRPTKKSRRNLDDFMKS